MSGLATIGTRLQAALLLALGLLAAATAVAPATAAESVRVRGGVHADYGRLVFDWDTPVGYSARIAEGRLIVEFDRAAAFDTVSAETHLFRYIDGVETGEGGRQIAFDLAGSYGLKGFNLGPKVVLDLLHGGGATAAGAPASRDAPPTETATVPLPAAEPASDPAAQPAQESLPPEIRVRVGTHADFERLVFDWDSPVDFALKQDGTAGEIAFARPARLDVAALKAKPPSMLRRFVDRRADGELQVRLEVAPGTRLRAFPDGPRVVVDLMRPDPSAPEPEARAETPGAAAPQVENPQADAGPPETAADEALQPDGAATASNEATAPDPAMPTSLLPSAAAPDSEATAMPAADPADTPPGPRQTASAPPSAPAAPAPQPAAAVSEAVPEAAAEPGTGTAARQSEGGFVVREAAPQVDGRPMPGTRAPATPPVLLRFAWPADVGAVALRRGATLLLGFDAEPPLDLAAAVAELAPELGPVVVEEVAQGSLLRFDAAAFYQPRLLRSGDGWLVEFRRAGGQSLQNAPVVAEGGSAAEAAARLRVAVDSPRLTMPLVDPETGERLLLVPLAGEGQAMPQGRDYPGFALVPTAQGLAILPHSDGVEVALAQDGVVLSGPEAALTAGRTATAAQRAPTEGASAPRLLDLEAWRRGPPGDFNAQRQALQRAVIDSDGADLGLARLDLARFYFAHGLASEALGVLALIDRENAELREDPQLLLMEAASRLLVGDHVEAQDLLARPALLEEPEADLWRGALAAEAQDWPAAATLLGGAENSIAEYPRPVRARLRLAAAEAALEAGDIGAAALRLEQARPDLVTDLEQGRHDFLNALLLASEGEDEQAQAILDRLAAAGLGAPSVRARLETVDRALATGELPPGEAIEQLEQLRFAWRGDAFEFALLQRLAGLYRQEGRWREALRALRQAATYFPGSPKADAAADELSALFARIFLGPDKPELPPLTALSLYEEFRELTPPGARGNALIEQLADRLVAVDLLDRAAGLLEEQVQFRLSGEEKARVGARLALIRLLDRQPRAALSALEISAVDGMPEALVRQRRHLQARALSDLGRSPQALAMLEGDDSLDALRLRAEILWADRDWAAAAVALEAALPEPAEALDAGVGIDVETSGQVLNLAVAQTLAGDAGSLERLREAWGAAMSEGPHAEAFALLAEDLDPASVATIAEQLAQVDRVQAFMASYRARLEDAPLSGVN